MPKKDNKVIKSHGKKTALRSPLALESSELYVDRETSALMLSIIITNVTTQESPVYVESAGLVIRCLDSNGNLIIANGREIISKTLKFPDEGLAPGKAVGIKTRIDLSSDIVADFDVYIGCIRNSNLVVTDFVRGDFFENSVAPIPLSAGMNDEEIYDVCDTVSDSATYYPDELSSLVWRCTCGEITDSSVCPKCGAHESELFAFFSNLVRPSVASGPSDGKKKKLPLIIAICSGAVFILAVVLIIFLIFILPDDDDKKPDDGQQVTQDVETLEEKLDKLNAMLEDLDFDGAMKLAKSDSELIDKVVSIADAAIEHYLSQNEYDRALAFCPDSSDPEGNENQILLDGYDHFINAKDYDSAIEYATKLEDPEKKNIAILLKIDLLVSEKKFTEAIDLAIESDLEDKKESVITTAINEHSAKREYDKALEYALLSNIENVPTDLAREAAYYYIENGEVARSLDFARKAKDPEIFSELASKLSNSQLLNNLNIFFPYLTLEKKQEIYASKVDIDKRAAVITADGRVIYGSGSIYTPEEGLSAVSVKTSAHHTVILLSDGSVVAFGDNLFGQCNVSLWKNVVSIDVGEYHTVALLDDGTVKACGSRTYSQCSVAGYENVIMISAGDFHTLVLLADGTVLSTGLNTSSQCDTADWKNIVYISAGSIHSVAITSSGRVLAIGNPSLGKCNTSEWTNVRFVSAGDSHTLAMLDDGSIVSCGGVIGGSYGSTEYTEDISYVIAGKASCLAVTKDGKLIFSGDGLPDVSHFDGVTVDPYHFFTADQTQQ
ncbi:MAG: hypothetical protein IJZ03_07070 [Clostridia bacterium]|nr:hypothetical protein [Clostridia bacterium]